jgi:sterol desaturase/sphingolipid hydroxylase (fatty acid hydroxylase superfamily)
MAVPHAGTWLLEAMHFLHSFPTTVKSFLRIGAYAIAIGLAERLSGGQTKQYWTRGFWHDLAYWYWKSSGLYRFLFTAALFGVLEPRLGLYKGRILAGLPSIPRVIIFYLIAEFVAYWYHRWQHSNRFLWAFHATHHSQEHLNFLGFSRFHPIDDFLMDTIPYLPLFVLGGSVQDWAPIFLLHHVLVMIEHSQMRWRFGPLYYVLVSPTFHSFHHSVEPEHYNRNFGATLSLFDFIFGTAVDQEERPKVYGLPDIKMPTLASTVYVPFQLVYKWYFQKQRLPELRPAEQNSTSTSSAVGAVNS